MFFLLSSCLLCPIIMVIQCYIMYRDKIHRKLDLCLESIFQRDKTSKVPNIRYKYRGQFLRLTAAV